MEISEFIGSILLGLVLICGNLYWGYSRARSILMNWAAQNGYEILHSEFRYFRKGPFFWTSSRGQTVFYVTVRDSNNRVRSGWVRCGGWWVGLWSDHTDVRWADELH